MTTNALPSFDTQLNEEQRKAATFDGKHLLVLAGAGTGKTRTIIARAQHLLQSGVPEHKILILSFTRKSAREIVERIKMQMPNATPGTLKGQTFHSWCMELIKSNPKVFPQHNYTLLDEEDAKNCMRFVCGTNTKDHAGHSIPHTKVYDVYSFCMNTRFSLSQGLRIKIFDNHSVRQELLDAFIAQNKPIYEGIIAKYIQYKRERQYLDYDDLLNIVARGLQNNPEARAYIASKYEHILVDEMQDTNPLQYEVLRNFYDDCHLFCVGDDAQSIYAFRGADFTTIHKFAEVVPNAEVTRLTQNYRSTQEILDLSNWLLKKSPLQYQKKLTAVRGKGKKPSIVHWDSEWEEANNITDKIIESKNNHQRPWRAHMVLARAGFALKKIEAACIQKGIPYVIYGGLGIMQSKHVRDLMAALRIVCNHRDELAWMRFLELFPGIGTATASRLTIAGTGAKDFESAINFLSKQRLTREIIKTLSIVFEHQNDAATAMSQGLAILEPIFQHLYKNEWQTRKNDFPILCELAQSVSSIQEFIAEYTLDPKLEQIDVEGASNHDKIILTTIHSAKGLEADICFIANVSPGNWPNPRSIDAGFDAVEEERRCLYVAMTRAKDELWLYRPLSAIHAVNTTFKPLSPKIPAHVRKKIEAKRIEKLEQHEIETYFLNDLPTRLYKKEVLKTAQKILDTSYRGPCVDVFNDFDFS